MLTAVSRGQRRWDDFKGTFSFFGPRAAGGSGASAAGRSSRDREARKVARLRAELEEAEGLKDLYVYTAVSTPLSPHPHSYPNRPSNPLRTRARP